MYQVQIRNTSSVKDLDHEMRTDDLSGEWKVYLVCSHSLTQKGGDGAEALGAKPGRGGVSASSSPRSPPTRSEVFVRLSDRIVPFPSADAYCKAGVERRVY